jgi:hypothetical protein
MPGLREGRFRMSDDFPCLDRRILRHGTLGPQRGNGCFQCNEGTSLAGGVVLGTAFLIRSFELTCAR